MGLVINPSVFSDSSISSTVAARNDTLIKLCQSELTNHQKWYHIGAEAYRRRRDAGETAFPKPVLLSSAKIIEIPSREPARTIILRCFVPQGKFTGIYLHIHGGGWVLSNAASQDKFLSQISEQSGMVCVSIEYRLAPECPSPAAQDDCFDVAHYLMSPASISVLPLTAEVRKHIVIGGESAGAHLAASTIIALKHKHHQGVAGAILNYGVFDLSLTPSASSSTVPLVLCREDMEEYIKAYVPEACRSREALQDPRISPLYANLSGLCPALFSCGTVDCLLV